MFVSNRELSLPTAAPSTSGAVPGDKYASGSKILSSTHSRQQSLNFLSDDK